MNEENNNVIENTENGENKIVLEFSSIQNGVETKQTQVNDEIKPTEEKNKKSIFPIVAIVVIILIVACVVGVLVYSSKKIAAQTGEVINSQLVYTNPVEGQSIDFKVNNSVTIVMTVTKIEDMDVTKLVTFDLNVKGYKEKIVNCTGWLENDKLVVSYKLVGNSFIYISDEKDAYNGMIVNVLNKDGKLHILNTFDDHTGLAVNNVVVKDDSLVLEISRTDVSGEYVRYDDNNEDDGNSGLSICKEKIQDLDKETIVSAYLVYHLTNNQLDIENVQIDSIISIDNYVLVKKLELCQ